MWVGINLILAGAAALIARNVIGSSVVNSLAKTEAARPAAEATRGRSRRGSCRTSGRP